MIEEADELAKNPTTDDLEQALLLYDEAIKIRQGLPLEVLEYRKILAMVWSNRGNILFTIGTISSLKDSISSQDEAIKLMQELPMEVLEYRKYLAMAWVNRGNGLREIGTTSSFKDSISSYDEAIKLMQELPIEVPEYRNILAMVWMNYGISSSGSGTILGLEDSISSYDEAIKLMKELPLEVPEYRYKLVMALMNRGNSLSEIGTTLSLEDSIASYNEAIEFGQELPLEVSEYCNILAMVWSNRGNTSFAIGTISSLKDSISSYNEAIKLMQELPLEVLKYRNELAAAWRRRGTSLSKIGTTLSLKDSIVSYDKAIDLQQKLFLDVPKYRYDLAITLASLGSVYIQLKNFSQVRMCIENALNLFPEDKTDINNLEGVNVIGYVFYVKMIYCLTIADYEEACDTADDALALIRRHSCRGVEKFRSRREELFSLALDAYLPFHFQFLPEIIREELDPDQPGNAADSSVMHEAAESAVLELLSRCSSDDHEFADELHELLLWLFKVQARIFIGKEEQIDISLNYFMTRGEPEEVKNRLREYIFRYPKNERGYLLLADFECSDGLFDDALKNYEMAAGLLLRNHGRFLENRKKIKESLSALVEVVVSMGLQWPEFIEDGARKVVDGQSCEVKKWLRHFRDEILDDTWRGYLSEFLECQEVEIEAKREQWFSLYENALREQGGKKERENTEQLLEEFVDRETVRTKKLVELLLKEFARGCVRNWGSVAEHISAGVEECWEKAFVEDFEILADNEEGRDELLEKFAIDCGRMACEQICTELAIEETEDYLKEAQIILKPVWHLLDEQDNKLIAAGLKMLADSDENMCRFAGLVFGQILERMLLKRLFLPVKRSIVEDSLDLNDVKAGKVLPKAAEEFLRGDSDKIMLGTLIRAFIEISRQGKKPDGVVPERVWNFIAALPGGADLLQVDSRTLKERKKALWHINDVRILAAHPKEQKVTPEELQNSWQKLAVADEDGFLHYFLSAFRAETIC